MSEIINELNYKIIFPSIVFKLESVVVYDKITN